MIVRLNKAGRVHSKLATEGWECVGTTYGGALQMRFVFDQHITDGPPTTAHCTIEEDGTLIDYKEPDLLYEIFAIPNVREVDMVDFYWMQQHQQEPTALAPGNP